MTDSGDLIVATAPALVAERFFGVPVYAVQVRNGAMRHANLEDYAMPPSLLERVFSITGLDSATEARPALSVASGTTQFGGATPQQLEAANDMPVLHGYSGTFSQTVAVLIDSQFKATDISTFLSEYGITTTYPIHYVHTGTNGTGTGDVLESTLDMETIASTAPGAYLALYTMSDLSENSIVEGINGFVNANASGSSATLSMSFGGCDNASTSYDNSVYQATLSGTARGQTFTAATGDYGYGFCSIDTKGPSNVPASDPEVLAVGGTSPDTQFSTVWGGGVNGQYGWVGSGAGASSYFGTPPFQTKLGKCGTRCVPDLALPADPGGGLIMYCSANCTFNGQNFTGFFSVGGTSLASPLAAAALGEISQMRGAVNGLTNNAIYASYYGGSGGNGYTSGRLVDITAGNNGVQAGTGWDYVSGVGTPDWFVLAGQSGL